MAAVLVSLVVVLTFTPMLSSKMLRPTPPSGISHALEHGYAWLREVYDRSLHAVLDYRPLVLLVSACVLVSIPFMFFGSKTALAPVEDQGQIFVSGTGPATATVSYINRYSAQIRAVMDSFPETDHVFQMNGTAGPGGAGANGLLVGMILKDWNQRTRSQNELIPLVQQKINAITGMHLVAYPRSTLPGDTGTLPVGFVLTSTNGYAQMYAAANRLVDAAMQTGQFAFLTTDLKYDEPQIVLNINRNVAANLGISMSDIGQNLSPLLSGGYVGRFDMSGHAYQIIPQVPDALRANSNALRSYYIRAADGQLIPLSTLVSISQTVEPEYLPQFQQLNAVTIQGTTSPGITLGQALQTLRQLTGRILPSTYSYDYVGQSRQFMQAGSSLMVTFSLSVLLVFLVLAGQFESFRDPLIVLVAVPMSVFGALVFLFLGVAPLNIYTEVGLVTLIGLITKQSILIVQFANVIQEEEGLDRRAAVEKASSIRLRPILMTTGAMVFGVVPLLVATGPGSISRFNIGLVIATGLTIGALFSLYVVPTIYTYVASVKEKVARAEDEPMSAEADQPLRPLAHDPQGGG